MLGTKSERVENQQPKGHGSTQSPGAGAGSSFSRLFSLGECCFRIYYYTLRGRDLRAEEKKSRGEGDEKEGHFGSRVQLPPPCLPSLSPNSPSCPISSSVMDPSYGSEYQLILPVPVHADFDSSGSAGLLLTPSPEVSSPFFSFPPRSLLSSPSSNPSSVSLSSL